MKQDATTEIKFLLHILRAWMHNPATEIVWDKAVGVHELATVVRSNRLEPLLAAVHLSFPQSGEGKAFQEECCTAAQRQTLATWNMLQQFQTLQAAFHADHIAVLAMRGPFSGASLYGDPALRHCLDMDLLVSPSHRIQALECAEKNGWVLQRPYAHKGFYLRHHLHWPLQHKRTEILCDLHWAADHPHQTLSVDVDKVIANAESFSYQGIAWHQPSIQHQFLLNAIHLAKHSSSPSSVDALVQEGNLLRWMDLALIVTKHSLPLEDITATSKEWNAEGPLSSVFAGLHSLWNFPLPSTAHPSGILIKSRALETAVSSAAWGGGFHPRRITQVLSTQLKHVRNPRTFFPSAANVFMFAWDGLRLVAARQVYLAKKRVIRSRLEETA